MLYYFCRYFSIIAIKVHPTAKPDPLSVAKKSLSFFVESRFFSIRIDVESNRITSTYGYTEFDKHTAQGAERTEAPIQMGYK